MKVELKHLAPYLPYGLTGISKEQYFGIETVVGYSTYGKEKSIELTTNIDAIIIEEFKPILRPLSDLTKEIEHNGEKFVPIDWFENKYYTLDLHKQCKRLLEEDGENWIYQSDYMLVEHLFEWHFDVFGLIPEGLAIDLNTLKS